MERMRRQEKGKAETNEQREKSNRNQGKLANAEEVYQACRDKWCEECDDILIPAKSDFLKMALRVVQFQQAQHPQWHVAPSHVLCRAAMVDEWLGMMQCGD